MERDHSQGGPMDLVKVLGIRWMRAAQDWALRSRGDDDVTMDLIFFTVVIPGTVGYPEVSVPYGGLFLQMTQRRL